jgi:hypothetical protein
VLERQSPTRYGIAGTVCVRTLSAKSQGQRGRWWKHPPWNPSHTLQNVRRSQAGKEEGHNYAPDNSVTLIKVFAHSFHCARFYSLFDAAQCSRPVVMALRRFIHADTALWAYAWTPINDGCRFQYKATPATWASETKAEYANHTDGEKGEDGHPTVISEPRTGSPTAGQYSDGQQAHPQKSEPPAQRFCLIVMAYGIGSSSSHRTLGTST